MHKSIPLRTLNEERLRPSKVTIYVEERYYLNTKRDKMQTNFDLIELKRVGTIKWEHEDNHFEYFQKSL